MKTQTRVAIAAVVTAIALLFTASPAPAEQRACVRLAFVDEYGRTSSRCSGPHALSAGQICGLVRAALAARGLAL